MRLSRHLSVVLLLTTSGSFRARTDGVIPSPHVSVHSPSVFNIVPTHVEGIYLAREEVWFDFNPAI